MQKIRIDSECKFFVKLEKPHFVLIFGPTWPENRKTRFFPKNWADTFTRAKIKKTLKSSSGEKLRINGRTDERTSARRVFHRTFTSLVQKYFLIAKST